MKIDKFNKEIPNLKGYSIGGLRVDDGEVLGFVLIDQHGNKRYILRTTGEFKVEDYW